MRIGVRIGPVRIGNVCVGGARVGPARIGNVCVGGARVGPVRIGNVRVGGVRVGKVRVRSARVVCLRIAPSGIGFPPVVDRSVGGRSRAVGRIESARARVAEASVRAGPVMSGLRPPSAVRAPSLAVELSPPQGDENMTGVSRPPRVARKGPVNTDRSVEPGGISPPSATLVASPPVAQAPRKRAARSAAWGDRTRHARRTLPDIRHQHTAAWDVAPPSYWNQRALVMTSP